ncbi:MAG: phospho-sugar mutase [Bacteroidales bacterium]|nr:phospho-sugar mutase [Bacteroidales bacterium]HOY39329.1 phospho-sugar mutase [Bacteroidales bacterium]HQP04871.1 phospho-sugar mutase [Bacteroidales bacterium]
MAEADLIAKVRNKATAWLNDNIDAESACQIEDMLHKNDDTLIESFYKDLEFGTGGLRGIMGMGSNRMNRFTVGMATQGLANYLIKTFPKEKIAVAIAHDSRNNSRSFAQNAADVLSANGITVYLFDELRPTPELSFAVRTLECKSGIVITASHNPKEYNGYKVYWADGGQIISPHDKNIIAEVRNISRISEVKFTGNSALIHPIGSDIDTLYIEKVKSLSLNPEVIQRQQKLSIVYTPIHGSGVNIVPMALQSFGFTNIIRVPEQDIPDGNFPTVHSPNPEEAAALSMALEYAKKAGSEIVMGTDPDADRVGIIVRDSNGEYVLLNGNQTASVLLYYLISEWHRKGKIDGRQFIVKTIVTTDLLAEIADSFNVKNYDVLTGFKYIAAIIREYEGKMEFIGGGEESYGYLAGDFVRDKDAVISCALIAEVAAWAKDNGKTIIDILKEIYVRFGFYKEKMISVTRTGKSGAEEIAAMMDSFRNQPPESICGTDVTIIHDYEKQASIDMLSQLRYTIPLPKSDVLQFELKDGSKITVRPSGTEPKIKFYFSLKASLQRVEDYDTVNVELDQLVEKMAKEIIR